MKKFQEWRQVSSWGGMSKVEICHHNPNGLPKIIGSEGCSGCDGPAYILASDVYEEMGRIKQSAVICRLGNVNCPHLAGAMCDCATNHSTL